MRRISRINASGEVFDIEAIALNKNSESNGGAEGEEAKLNFKTKCSDPTKATTDSDGYVSGNVGINAKGNLSVESKGKHLNLEAEQSIQVKPKSGKVIMDTGRAITEACFDMTNPAAPAFKQGKGSSDVKDANHIRIEGNFDDISDFNDVMGNVKKTFRDGERSKKEGSEGYWAEIVMAGRSHDIRCHNHGGIALQVAGADSEGHENKIKFESSRAVPISEDAQFPGDYMYEGGKGIEFGTFNSVHTSLFTKTYRFNKDGMVYAVFRKPIVATPTTAKPEKVDYPTNDTDDFKDFFINTEGEDTTIDAVDVLGVTWEDIVKGILYLKKSGAIE